ncbi:MAG: NTP transferase domain-containing protein [Desulfobacteraceae bacterium]
MHTSAEKITALIPAAGMSSRMEEFKPLLLLNGKTLIECAIDTFKQAGISNILVVTGHRSGELDPVIQKAGAVAVFNPDYQNGMFSSLVTGIRCLPSFSQAFFVLPADIPLVRPATVLRILDEYRTGTADILYPVYRGRRGHPTIISAKLADNILAWSGDGGLRKCLDQFQGQTGEIVVADRGIMMDADMPEDYKSLIEQAAFEDIPCFEECMEFLETIYPVDKRIINHCKAVKETAAILSDAAIENGTFLDRRLVAAGALLHDISKGEKNHAIKGASFIRAFGFPDVARIVETHTDIQTDPLSPVNEAEIVYLADKITVAAEMIYPFKKRFDKKIKAFRHLPDAVAAIKKRYENAEIIHHKIEKIVGRPMEKILKNRP